MFDDCLLFFARHLRKTLRNPSALLLASFHPFIWLVLFGPLFQSVASLHAFRSDSYYQFLAPGIAIMSAFFGSTYAGLTMLADIQSGLLDRFLATPVSRSAIVIGPLLNTAVQTTCQAAIIVLTAIGLGARPQGGAAGILLVFLAVALVATACAALSHGVALLTRTQRLLISIVNFISMPLVFLSSMMMPHELMPAWMRRLALLNPVDWAVTASRAAFDGGDASRILQPMLLLAFATLAAWLFAARCLVAYQRHG